MIKTSSGHSFWLFLVQIFPLDQMIENINDHDWKLQAEEVGNSPCSWHCFIIASAVPLGSGWVNFVQSVIACMWKFSHETDPRRGEKSWPSIPYNTCLPFHKRDISLHGTPFGCCWIYSAKRSVWIYYSHLKFCVFNRDCTISGNLSSVSCMKVRPWQKLRLEYRGSSRYRMKSLLR